jgi:hypothetical protein
MRQARYALDNGKYTLTELDMARQRCPSPVDRVILVIIDPALAAQTLPGYLSNVRACSH